MKRKEIYAWIKEKNLANDFKLQFGKHYTNASNEELSSYYMSVVKNEILEEDNKETQVEEEEKEEVTKEDNNLVRVDIVNYEAILKNLIKILADKHILLQSEVNKLLS